ncbi:hypothetical protein ACU4GD_07720 [Cupriavidus basilensis]
MDTPEDIESAASAARSRANTFPAARMLAVGSVERDPVELLEINSAGRVERRCRCAMGA